MTIAAVKEKLHHYIDEADGKRAKALLELIEGDLSGKDYNFDEQTINILQERLEEYLTGSEKGYTMEETIARAEKYIAKK